MDEKVLFTERLKKITYFARFLSFRSLILSTLLWFSSCETSNIIFDEGSVVSTKESDEGDAEEIDDEENEEEDEDIDDEKNVPRKTIKDIENPFIELLSYNKDQIQAYLQQSSGESYVEKIREIQSSLQSDFLKFIDDNYYCTDFYQSSILQLNEWFNKDFPLNNLEVDSHHLWLRIQFITDSLSFPESSKVVEDYEVKNGKVLNNLCLDRNNNEWQGIDISKLRFLRKILLLDDNIEAEHLKSILRQLLELNKNKQVKRLLKKLVSDNVKIVITNSDLQSDTQKSNGDSVHIDAAGLYCQNYIILERSYICSSLVHEIGHHIDERLGYPSQCDTFKKMHAQFYPYFRKYISDFWGPAGDSNGCREAFAELIEAYTLDYSRSLRKSTNTDQFREYFSNELADFLEECIDRWISSGVQTDN